MSASLDSLSLGFRSKYLTFDELTAQLERWEKAFPELVRKRSIAKSEEGRDIWLVTLGRDPDRIRPAAWIDANIHASEVTGSSVALGIIEDLLRASLGEAPGKPAGAHDLPAHLASALVSDVLFYIVPRLSPDGAERVLSHRHFVRSNHRDHRLGKTSPYWRHDDIDQDGRSLLMRVRDDAGDFVESTSVKGLMLPRRIEDAGPFYRLYPEGFIEHFDGFTIPVPSFMSDTETDLNRNFPSSWQAEPHQHGAGPYPASEPESRAITEFAVRHPNIFAWMSLHTFGGVFIRPLGDKPDSKMDPHDASVFRLLEQWGDSIVGYPTVSGFTEFTYEPDKPLCGDLSNFAYVERGSIGFVCELWDFFAQAGFEIKRPFIKNYQDHVSRDHIEKIAAWDKTYNGGRIVGEWKPFTHPQLGELEVGGYDPLIGVWNPPEDRLAEVCDKLSRYFLRIASIGPRLGVARLESRSLGNGLFAIEAVVENRGYLPTYVLGSSRSRPWNDDVRAALRCDAGVDLVSGDAVQTVGHLAGWGGNDRNATPMLARTTGAQPRKLARWVVRGAGNVTVTAGCARTGSTSASLVVA